MFGNAKNEQKVKTNGLMPSTSSSSSNSLIQGTNIEGTIQADKDIRIDGSLQGSLNCKGKVIIGPTGFISGDVQCENAVLVRSFTTKDKAMKYLETPTRNPKDFLPANAIYQVYPITQKNYREVIKARTLDSYKEFFEANYK